MRVMLLCDVLSRGARGGAERVVLELGRELTRRGGETATILPATAHTAETLAELGSAGFEARTARSLLPVDVRRRFIDVWRLARLVREWRPDVVSLHTGCQWLRIKDVAAAALGGSPCVVTVHGGERFESELQRRRTRRAALLARRLVVHGSMVKRSLAAAGIEPHRIDFVPCGVPEPRVRPSRAAARERLGVPPDAFVVSTLARLVLRKGVADLLAAFGRLRARGDGARLLVGGDGPERTTLEAVSRSTGSKAHFLGELADPSDLYAASDVFVLPARQEAFGLVYIEAAHHGVPSIGVSTDGTADAIVHDVTGLLVRPGAIDELAASIARLEDDAALGIRLGEAARRRARDAFSVAAMTDGYLKTFTAALGSVAA
ncbi:MAG TPA: glycosyltransferase family 4 protein [Polyangiaceae bacterium]|nr:glycosyltransferase family 4 protein [Polyangiaceae bacterium]